MTPLAAAARTLERAIGLDPAAMGDGELAAAVGRRVADLGLTHAADYPRLLAGDAEEAARLAEELLVLESWFFRDGKPFELLVRVLCARHPSPARPLRILSAPCARGEEPYSMAIALLAAGVPAEAFHVEAVDLSRRALDEARRGEYGPRALRSAAGAPERAWLGGRVAPGGGGSFAVTPEVRRRVSFRRANLLALETAAGPPGYDAILCRNALIYLTAAARTALVEACWRLLGPGGLLVVGHAEAVPLLERRFRRHPEVGAFAFVRLDEPEVAPLRQVVAAAAPAAPPPPGSTASAAPPAPAGATPERLLASARALADRGRYADAASLLSQSLAQRPADADAYHLLGVVHAARGDDAAARAALEKALYLDPEHAPSLGQLALLLETVGDAAGAARLRRRASRPRGAP